MVCMSNQCNLYGRRMLWIFGDVFIVVLQQNHYYGWVLCGMQRRLLAGVCWSALYSVGVHAAALLSVAVAPAGVGAGHRPEAASWPSLARCTWSSFTCPNCPETPCTLRRWESFTSWWFTLRGRDTGREWTIWFVSFFRWWTSESCWTKSRSLTVCIPTSWVPSAATGYSVSDTFLHLAHFYTKRPNEKC